MSININSDEKSILMRTDLCNNISTTSVNNTIYNLVKMDVYSDNGGIDEYGILSILTKKFANNKIPILVISSFNNNYVLYPSEYHDKVVGMCDGKDFE
jgi:hypothetical protein